MKLIRSNKLLRARKFLFGSSAYGIKPTPVSATSNIQCRHTKSDFPDEKKKSVEEKKKDQISSFRFKNYDVKSVFKEFYSLYGPLFIFCHIIMSLTSLGFLSGLVWMNVDLTQMIPEFVLFRLGDVAINVTSGSKFIVAYAIYKAILPFRLAGTIWVTQYISSKVKLKRSAEAEVEVKLPSSASLHSS